MANKPLRGLLTTKDNPYNPFDDWITWYYEDIRLGYDTCGWLARLSNPSDTIDDDAEVNAMRSIVETNYSGMHIIVTPDDFNPFLKLQ